MSPRLPSVVAVALWVSVLNACANDLTKATEITHTQVLGARVEVVGDAERATPAPGESAMVTWVMVDPDSKEDFSGFSSMFLACTYPAQFTGEPQCQELLDVLTGAVDAGAGDAGTAEVPTLERVECTDTTGPIELGTIDVGCVQGKPVFEVPVSEAYKAERKLVRGIMCRDGAAFFDPTLPDVLGCTGPAAKSGDENRFLVYSSIRIAHKASERNRNPDLSTLKLTIRADTGEGPGRALGALVADALPDEDHCVDNNGESVAEGVPVVDAYTHAIDVEIDAKIREAYSGKTENLELSVYSPKGDLEKRFLLFEGDDLLKSGKLRDTMLWHAPERQTLSKHGQLARFFVTVRDQRGGFTMVERQACVFSRAAQE